MKFNIISLLLMSLAVGLSVAMEMKSVMVSFPNDTPDHVMAQIKSAFSEAVSSAHVRIIVYLDLTIISRDLPFAMTYVSE